MCVNLVLKEFKALTRLVDVDCTYRLTSSPRYRAIFTVSISYVYVRMRKNISALHA